MAKASSRRIERDKGEVVMGQMDVGGVVMLDDGSFRVKSTGEKAWLDDEGTLRDEDGNEVDVDVSPQKLDNPGGDGVDFTEGT